MKVTYLKSAAVLLEDSDLKILCDPWLMDGAYYGSWCHYPPPHFEPKDFDDVDYIYLSHIHPDHFHEETFRRIDSDIPVLIHDYRWDYLKSALEDLGFPVIELPHNVPMDLGGDWHIRILAADGCDPEACGNFFGCAWFDEDETNPGSTQVDSMAAIDNGEYTVVDTNDCPFPMAEGSCRTIKRIYGDVDLLCHQYSAAQFYPQCMEDYTHEEKLETRDEVIREKHQLAEEFIDLFEPTYYMPFAGEYVLAGSLAHLDQYTANPPRSQAYEYFSTHVDPDEHTCVFLNSGEYLDLDRDDVSKEFVPIDPERRDQYIEEVLALREFEYERDPIPALEELQAYVPDAYGNLERKRRQIGFESDSVVLVPLLDDACLKITLNGDGYEYLDDVDLRDVDGYVMLNLDPRLLKRIFEGPHRAYWSDAKIGSHIGIRKQPDIYERGLYYTMSAFHV